jgi:16S rRNA (cytosine967-C5)-methyltransferase
MTPAARLAAAIEVLDAILRERAPAGRTLADWGRSHRFAGAKDRAAIADRVHDCLRRRRSYAWAVAWETGDESARAAVIGSALAQGLDPATLFTGLGHAPAPLTPAERLALSRPAPPPPDAVRLDAPDWLEPRLRRSLGAAFEPAMAALRDRAPVDMRVNLLRADVAAATASLAADGIAAAPGPHAATCLRAPPGAPVAASRAYAAGVVELQDAASQAAADLAAARPGETVLDFCAGGGGKTLALAAAMRGRGRLLAHDVDPRRMRDLPARAARAGARVEPVGPGDLPALEGACDLVFVDAPCSGSGSWRRDPSGKWRLDARALAELAVMQARIAAQAVRFVRPGGRLAFATCSVLDEENGHPAPGAAAAPMATLRLTPADGADGFFCALWLF